jgi:hypothetical protein
MIRVTMPGSAGTVFFQPASAASGGTTGLVYLSSVENKNGHASWFRMPVPDWKTPFALQTTQYFVLLLSGGRI